MDEQPNVNNLNGIPNFGHGLPSDVPEEAVVAADPEAVFEDAPAVPVDETPAPIDTPVETLDIPSDVPVIDEAPVDITNQIT